MDGSAMTNVLPPPLGATLGGGSAPWAHRDEGVRPQVRALTVLYDQQCSVCRAARSWMLSRRPLVELHFVPVGGNEAMRRFPHLDMAQCRQEITVITDQGYVYRGKAAFILCLWSLRSTRSLANDLAAGRRALVLSTLTGATAWFRELSLRTGCGEACQTRRS